MNYTFAGGAVDESRPLIYMWEIRYHAGQLIGRYVGKAKAGANRPRKYYARNVANILAGKPYRKRNPDGYRRVHHALAEAEWLGYTLTLSFLCNVNQEESINEAEQRCIREQNCRGIEAWQLNA